MGELPRGLEQPFYYVLVDLRDRRGAQVAYVDVSPLSTSAVVGDASGGLSPFSPSTPVLLHPLLPQYFGALGAGADGAPRFVPLRETEEVEGVGMRLAGGHDNTIVVDSTEAAAAAAAAAVVTAAVGDATRRAGGTARPVLQ